MRTSFTIGLALAALGAGGVARAQAAGGALEISGTSTVRPWSCRETTIGSVGAVPAGAAYGAARSPTAGSASSAPAGAGGEAAARRSPAGSSSAPGDAATGGLTLTFPVGGIDCGDAGMNGQLRQALKANRYPTITFGLPAPEVTRALAAGPGPVLVDGQLTIAGETKPVQTEVTVTRGPGQAVQVQGTQALRMTDFGVKPPVLMLGLLKVRDLVHVAFDVVLRTASLGRLGAAPR